MGRVPSPSADRSEVEERSTAIDVKVSGLEFQGFRFGRVLGYYELGLSGPFLALTMPPMGLMTAWASAR